MSGLVIELQKMVRGMLANSQDRCERLAAKLGLHNLADDDEPHPNAPPPRGGDALMRAVLHTNNRAMGSVPYPQTKRRKAASTGIGKMRVIPENPINRRQRRAAAKLQQKGT
jgi:hypothetical protein